MSPTSLPYSSRYLHGCEGDKLGGDAEVCLSCITLPRREGYGFSFSENKRENFGKAVTISLSVPLGVLEIVDWTVLKYPKY